MFDTRQRVVDNLQAVVSIGFLHWSARNEIAQVPQSANERQHSSVFDNDHSAHVPAPRRSDPALPQIPSWGRAPNKNADRGATAAGKWRCSTDSGSAGVSREGIIPQQYALNYFSSIRL